MQVILSFVSSLTLSICTMHFSSLGIFIREMHLTSTLRPSDIMLKRWLHRIIPNLMLELLAIKLDDLSAGGPIRFDNELKGRNHDHYNIFSLSDPFAPTVGFMLTSLCTAMEIESISLFQVAAYSRGALTTFHNEKSPVKKRSAGHFIKCRQADVNSNGAYNFRVVTVEAS